MQIGIVLFPGFTPLDAVGPYHALSGLPDVDVAFIAEQAGPVGNGGAFTMEAHAALDDVDTVDVLLVPGGLAAVSLAREGGPLVEWIRRVHPTTQWTTSVCTGSLLLGAAGVLEGLDATTHWSCTELLRDYGANPVDRRWVQQGKVITSAGVSAGIDMSLHLVAQITDDRYAQALQLDMEYDPQPPFQAGHPRSAPAEVTAFVRALYDGTG